MLNSFMYLETNSITIHYSIYTSKGAGEVITESVARSVREVKQGSQLEECHVVVIKIGMYQKRSNNWKTPITISSIKTLLKYINT